MAENIFAWSITASDNDDADPAVPWAEGMFPGAVNNGARAIMAALARFRDDITGVIPMGGTTNTFTLTSRSGYTALSDGLFIAGKCASTNTGQVTLNLNAIGQKDVKYFGPDGESALIGGEIRAGMTCQFRYDAAASSASGAFILLNPSRGPNVGDIKIWPTDTAPSGWLYCNGSAVSRTTFAALFTVLGSGAIYGSGDGSTTFNVPDLRGRAPFGKDGMGSASSTSRITVITATSLAASGGVDSVSLSVAQLPSHSHTASTSSSGGAAVTSGNESAGHVHNYDRTTEGSKQQFVTGVGAEALINLTITNTTGGMSNPSNTHTHDTTVANHTHSVTVASTGSGSSINNLPPTLILNFIIKV